jgi:hypothetical protein
MVLVKTRRATELVRCQAQAGPPRLSSAAVAASLSRATPQPPPVAASLATLLPLTEDAFAAALGSFALPPSDAKPDLLHWLPLLNRLDALLERVCAAAPECALAPAALTSQTLPRGVVLAALRLTTALLENSHNRQLYGSAEARGPSLRGAFAPSPAAGRLARAAPP